MTAKSAARDTAQDPPTPGRSAASERRVDVDNIVVQFERLDAEGRATFLSIVAHDLTVAIRSIVYDPPVTEDGVERVKWINEAHHHLTSCLDPRRRWSAPDEAALVRGMIEDSSRLGLDRWLLRAVAAAAGSMTDAKTSRRDEMTRLQKEPEWKNSRP